MVSSLRYELAIPLPEDDVEAANIAALSLILVGLSALLTGVLVWRLGPACHRGPARRAGPGQLPVVAAGWRAAQRRLSGLQ
ncbi:hypothetical protein [Thiorhodococcus minor]|uniref:hypothetical protein n=1 Tax=Thiorhodococcus minor TaxID=57489 RepID=UPI0013D9923A|nr:hypothetical protein [Thiorhodococcus minor]